MFDKILIANRGEIACRISKTAHRLGIDTVAVYSDADRDALHVQHADESVHIGGAQTQESYLDIDAILEATEATGAEAIHPGYGFLSENPAFASACEEAGIPFVGPSSEVIEVMGTKDQAKQVMEEAGVPVVPGYNGAQQDPDVLQEQANTIGYPLLIKPVAGGGGVGMRLVKDEESFQDQLEASRREADSAFGNDDVLLEKYLEKPRHIEVQVFGDDHGNAVHVFERDCSLQRRYQKVVEEAPAPGVPESFRQEIGEAAVQAVEELDYTNAGTIEFIVDVADGIEEAPFYFMEMNTRLQVEHPVTEMITGQDLVEWQLRVAAGEELPARQEELTFDGHAFEARLYAENPAKDFLPQTGKIQRFLYPDKQDNVRVDTGVRDGDEMSIHYDPMIAKFIVRGGNRRQALRKMHQVLLGSGIVGLTTNLEFHVNVFEHEEFQKGNVETNFISNHRHQLIPEDYGQPSREDVMMATTYFLSGQAEDDVFRNDMVHDPWNVSDNWRMNTVMTKNLKLLSGEQELAVSGTCEEHLYEIEYEDTSETVEFQSFEDGVLRVRVDGTELQSRVVLRGTKRDISLLYRGRSIPFHLYDPGVEEGEGVGEGDVRASMPGKVLKIRVEEGDEVEKNAPILVMEAMKMEMTVSAGRAGTVEELPFSEGDQVKEGDLLVSISS